MRLDITGRHVDITAALRQLIDRRLAKLERLLNDSAISAQVILTKEKYRPPDRDRRPRPRRPHAARPRRRQRLAGVGARGRRQDRAAGAEAEGQVERAQAAGSARRTERSRRPAPEPAPAPRIIRATRYAVKPMSIEDAALRVEATAETFVVFRNADTDAVSILYRRNDGNYGLIEPD